MTSTIIWHEGDCITMKERKREKQKYFIVKTQRNLSIIPDTRPKSRIN